MNLLLDTHVLLWWLADDPRLGIVCRERIGDPATRVVVSAASAWEIAIKYQIGRLTLPGPPEAWFEEEQARNGFEGLPVGIADSLAAGALPIHHRDPFDRMLIVQARQNGLALVTSDRAMEHYDVTLMAADA